MSSAHFACTTASLPSETTEGAFRRIAWAGFRAVEVSRDYPLGDPEEIRGALAAHGLVGSAFRLPMFPGEGSETGAPIDLDSEEDIARVLAHAGRWAEKAGLDHLVCPAPTLGDRPRLLRILRLTDLLLEDSPTPIELAHGPGGVLEERRHFHWLWEDGVPRRFGIAVDPALLPANSTAPWLDGWPVPPGRLYLTDRLGDHLCPLGQGELDWDAGWPPEQRGLVAACAWIRGVDPWEMEPALRESHFDGLNLLSAT